MDRTSALVSLVALRFGGVGLTLILAPRWFRNVLADFIKMSDGELRVIGYVLVGAAGTMLAQQAGRRALSAKIEALSRERAATAAAA